MNRYIISFLLLVIPAQLAFGEKIKQYELATRSPYVNNFLYDNVDHTRISDFYVFSEDYASNPDIEYLRGKYDLVAMMLLDERMAENFLNPDTSTSDLLYDEVLKNQYYFFSNRINNVNNTKFYKLASIPDLPPREALINLISVNNTVFIDSVCRPTEENSLVFTISIKDNSALVHVVNKFRDGFAKYHAHLENNFLTVTTIAETIDYDAKIKDAKKEKKYQIADDKYVKRLYKRRINRNSYGLGVKFGVGMAKVCNFDYILDPFFSPGLAYNVGVTYDFAITTMSSSLRYNDGNSSGYNNFFMQGGIFFTNYSSYFDTKTPGIKQIYYVHSYNAHLKPFGYRLGLGKGCSLDFALGLNIGLIHNYGKWRLIPKDNIRFAYGVIASFGATIIDYIHLSLNYSYCGSTYDSTAYAVYRDFPITQSSLLFNVGFNFGPLMKKNKNKVINL